MINVCVCDQFYSFSISYIILYMYICIYISENVDL